MIFYFHKYNKQNFPDTYILYNEISGKCKILSWKEYLEFFFDQYPVGVENGRLTEITLIPRDVSELGGYIHFDMDILCAQDSMLYHTTMRNLSDLRNKKTFQYSDISEWIKMLIDWKNK